MSLERRGSDVRVLRPLKRRIEADAGSACKYTLPIEVKKFVQVLEIILRPVLLNV